jgi:DNA repair protein RecO (recombination protein O)
MKPKTYRTEAIVLKKSRLREADSTVTLYTPHFGKIRAVAKGVLRPKSKLRGHIEPLVHSQMQLAHGRNIDTVTQSETLESFLPLRNDLLATSYAIYVAELTDRFSPDGEANYPLFKLLRDTLRRLCQTHNDRSLLLHFELHLLGHLGYRPELHEGGVICPGCRERGYALRPLSVNALKALRFLQDNDYDSTQRLRITSELSLALQPLLHGYINYLLDREVKSMTWIDRLRAT